VSGSFVGGGKNGARGQGREASYNKLNGMKD